MAYPYAGDRQLEPDDDSFECPHCTAQMPNQRALFDHYRTCSLLIARMEIEEPESEL